MTYIPYCLLGNVVSALIYKVFCQLLPVAIYYVLISRSTLTRFPVLRVKRGRHNTLKKVQMAIQYKIM